MQLVFYGDVKNWEEEGEQLPVCTVLHAAAQRFSFLALPFPLIVSLPRVPGDVVICEASLFLKERLSPDNQSQVSALCIALNPQSNWQQQLPTVQLHHCQSQLSFFIIFFVLFHQHASNQMGL